MPRTVIDLQTVEGFGEVKATKYGADILKIVSKYMGNNFEKILDYIKVTPGGKLSAIILSGIKITF